MRKISQKIVLLIFSILVFGCNDENKYVTISGRVEREINGEGIANQIVILTTNKINGSGYWSTTTVIDSKQVITDLNGSFKVSMKQDGNTYLYVFKPQDNTYTEFQKSFNPNEDVLIEVNKFVKFKIFVNNTTPFDNNDFIDIDFYSGFAQSFRTKIENFGIANVYYPPQGGQEGYQETAWRGMNVNSIIYYNVPENADDFKLRWYKQKNGLDTDGFTANIPYQTDLINEYYFNY